jgi:ABC-type multidrug transport system ATPase subunit
MRGSRMPARTNLAMLTIDRLTFHYPGTPLFTALSLRIPAGITLVRGGDGRGKSTLLRLLAGELAPQTGELRLGNATPKDQAVWRQQVFRTDPRTEALDRLTTHAWMDTLRSQHPEFDAQRWTDVTERLGLVPHLGKPIYMLSTGSKRKLWLAGAFSAGTKVTLLDEPFAALDKGSIATVIALLKDQAGDAGHAWVLADYEAPTGLQLAATIDLGQ